MRRALAIIAMLVLAAPATAQAKPKPRPHVIYRTHTVYRALPSCLEAVADSEKLIAMQRALIAVAPQGPIPFLQQLTALASALDAYTSLAANASNACVAGQMYTSD